MNKQLMKDALREYSRRDREVNPDLWPAILRQLPLSAQPQRELHRRAIPGSRLLRPALLVGTAIVAVIVLTMMSQPTQPPVVSAADLLARAETATGKLNASALASFHGLSVYKFKNSGDTQFTTGREERWLLSPGKYRVDALNRTPDGREERSIWNSDGTSLWTYQSFYNQVQIRDPSSTNFKPFRQIDLDTLLKTAGNNMYDVKLVGTEEVAGRKTYVLDLTFRPESHVRVDSPHQKLWVDQQAFFILRLESWDSMGQSTGTQSYESFEVNGAIDPGVFSLNPPEGAQILDLRPAANDQDLVELWKQAAKQVPYSLFVPSYYPENSSPGRPYYDATRKVVTIPYYALHNGAVLLWAVVEQGPPAAFERQGEGAPVMVGDAAGQIYKEREHYSLVFDRGGTQIMVQTWNGLNSYQEIAQSLQPVPQK